MRATLSKIKNHPKYAYTLNWAKLISLTGGAQAVVQVCALLTGLIIVRLLPVKEYAYYTLANTMLGTLTVLADGGISSGVMANGGNVWKDRKKLGAVLETGLNLRKKFATISLIVVVPILYYLLKKQGADNLVILWIVLALIPSFFAALSDSLLEIIPKLHQDIKNLQFNQMMVGIFRLMLSAMSIFFFPFTVVALLCNGVPRIYGNLKLRSISNKLIERGQLPDPKIKRNILSIVKKTLPGSIYYCFSGQIQIWLISIFGSAESLAHIGAIGRLMAIMTLFSMIFNTLFEPRFARLPNQKKLVKKRFAQLVGLLFLLGLILSCVVGLFPNEILAVLGKPYMELRHELLLITISSCLALITSTIYRLNLSRGIIIEPYIFIPSIILVQAITLSLLDLSIVTNVLWFSIIVSAMGAIFRIAHFFFGMNRREIGVT